MEVSEQLSKINEKLDNIEKIEEQLVKTVDKEEVEIKEMEDKEQQVERELLTIGHITIKRSHLLELARGAAGAFLGVGLGQALGNSVALANKLPWVNIIGILLFIIIVTGVLIYRNDKDAIKDRNPLPYIAGKLTYLYIISLLVQLLGLVLFNNFPGWDMILAKSLIIGSYTAMSSAVAFTLI